MGLDPQFRLKHSWEISASLSGYHSCKHLKNCATQSRPFAYLDGFLYLELGPRNKDFLRYNWIVVCVSLELTIQDNKKGSNNTWHSDQRTFSPPVDTQLTQSTEKPIFIEREKKIIIEMSYYFSYRKHVSYLLLMQHSFSKNFSVSKWKEFWNFTKMKILLNLKKTELLLSLLIITYCSLISLFFFQICGV